MENVNLEVMYCTLIKRLIDRINQQSGLESESRNISHGTKTGYNTLIYVLYVD